MPLPCVSQNSRQAWILGALSEKYSGFVATGDENCWIAGAAIAFHHFNFSPNHGACPFDDLSNREAVAMWQVWL